MAQILLLIITILSLTHSESARAAASEDPRDIQRFPHTMAFLSGMKLPDRKPAPDGNEHLIHSPHVVETTTALWEQFFKAAASDHLTILRAFALLAREIKSRGITVFGPGYGFEQAVAADNVDLGLAIPTRFVGMGVWEPDPAVQDPEFLLHLTIVYKEKFIHQFPDEVLPANIQIGTGDETDYYVDRERHHGYVVSADLYYGPHGIGFKNVHGISGQKHGLVGFLQSVLFFLPDSIHSMLIDESRNVMTTEALINTTVENFETREIYQIRYRDGHAGSGQVGGLGASSAGQI